MNVTQFYVIFHSKLITHTAKVTDCDKNIAPTISIALSYFDFGNFWNLFTLNILNQQLEKNPTALLCECLVAIRNRFVNNKLIIPTANVKKTATHIFHENGHTGRSHPVSRLASTTTITNYLVAIVKKLESGSYFGLGTMHVIPVRVIGVEKSKNWYSWCLKRWKIHI